MARLSGLTVRAALGCAAFLLAGCGSSSSSSPTPSTTAAAGTTSESATASTTPSPSPAEVTVTELIAVGQKVYGAGGFHTCDVASNAPGYWANCPFTATFQARLNSVPGIPWSTWETPEHPAGGYEILCHCQTPASSVSYTATPFPNGGTVVATTTGFMYRDVYTMTINDVGGQLLVDAITFAKNGSCATPIEADPWLTKC
jgi:hypothetical protein